MGTTMKRTERPLRRKQMTPRGIYEPFSAELRLRGKVACALHNKTASMRRQVRYLRKGPVALQRVKYIVCAMLLELPDEIFPRRPAVISGAV